MQKHSCATCARRKVKCDKLSPCSNCSKSQSECVYGAAAPSQRHRKRPADEDILFKVREYEALLRKNDIQFQPLDNSWIPSLLQDKLSPRLLQVPIETGWLPEAQDPEQKSQPTVPQSETECLWYGLPKELRDPTIETLRRPGKEVDDEGTSGLATSLLLTIRPSVTPQLLELHPAPKHIFKLWQAFAENANPLTKVVHAPTLQQRILDVSWNLETVPRPLEAVMFSVYALGITSMKTPDCIQEFGETRSALLNRYRTGAAQALIAAELHSTRDLEVLQAFVLFLLLEPRSDVTATLVAVAIRIGHKMGLHRTGADAHMPFFEQEMRIRVWWQIIRLDSWFRRKVLGLMPLTPDHGDLRLPLNLNDTDLHPHMANWPVEHSGATEMLFCLMRYEVLVYTRKWLAVAADTKDPYQLVASTSPEHTARKRKVLSDLENLYDDKYLCHCDPNIPLHSISTTVAALGIHCARFKSYHPRHQPDGGRHMSQEDREILFESSIRLLQLYHDVRRTTFSAHLLEFMRQGQCELEALVYMVSELRQRVSGELVRTAWMLVGRMYLEYPQLLQDDNKVCTSLADLTLKAWEARMKEVEAQKDAVPDFIGVLQQMRRNVNLEDAPTVMIGGLESDADFQFGLLQDDPLDWVCWNWNDLPQL